MKFIVSNFVLVAQRGMPCQ